MAKPKKLGRYELRRVLGKGAMGVVYEGFDPTLGRRVAVKTILRSVALDEETERAYAERFEREARAVARLNHPHIVQVHDFGEQDNVAYLVMEFIEGRELRSFFEAHEGFDSAEAARIMGELLDALDFAHERGVIHRDVKPANVMLDAQRRVKLADFGVARIQDSDRSMAGTMVGTPAFMSPEQIKGGKVDGRTDIFSAGTILYQLLTGEQPFKGEGAWTVSRKIIEEDPPPPSALAVSVSPALDAVVRKALAKEPSQRFGKARDFAATLRSAIADPAQALAAVQSKPQGKAETKASETELEFWRSIQNRDDLEELELYVEQFPDGAYTQLARLKIAKLRAPLEAARKAAEEKARLEAEEKSRREAEEKAKREAADRARRAAEETAKRDAAEKARREADEAAKRDAEQRARREAEEKLRRDTAAKLKEEAARRAKAVRDDDATVALAERKAPDAAPAVERKSSYAIPAVVAAVFVAGAVGAYFVLGRKPASAPVAEAPAPTPAPAPVSAPSPAPKPEITAADIEKIRKETEERVRREFADKSVAEQAAAAKAASEKAIQEKQLAMKVAAEKAAADKAAADKAQAEKLAAAKSAAERAALEKAAGEKAAAGKAALERAAAERAAQEKAAAEKAAAEKAAAAKAAAAAKPGWPSVGDRWIYEARDVDFPEKKFQITVEVQSVTATAIRELSRVQGGQAVSSTHTATPQLTGVAPGVASFAPFLRAFQEPKAGDRWASIDYKQLWECHSTLTCSASARIVGMEKVSVKAGTYDAWKVAVELAVRGQMGPGVATLIYWYAESAKRVVKYQFRQNVVVLSFNTWAQPNMDVELLSYTPLGGRPATAPAEKSPAEKMRADKAPVDSVEAQLERFIQRKGRDRVLNQEPPLPVSTGTGGLDSGEVVYVNDGSCPTGRIREVTGSNAYGTNIRGRPSRCISLAD